MALGLVNSCANDERNSLCAKNYQNLLREIKTMSLAVALQADIQLKTLTEGKAVVFGREGMPYI
jgi:hypothetical protein